MRDPDRHLDQIHRQRIRYSDSRVQAAAEFIGRTGIVDELSALVDCPVGRPRRLTVEGILVGMALCARRNDGAVFLDQTTDILHWGIPAHWRERFAVPERVDDARGFEAAYAVVRRLFHKIIDAIDPSPLPKNKRLTTAEMVKYLRAADAEDLSRRRDLLTKVAGAVLEASVHSVRHYLDEHWDGSIAVDATPIATYARGVRTGGEHTATDPDAGWYVREGNHRDPDTTARKVTQADHTAKPTTSKTKSSRKGKPTAVKYLFGYDATLVIARDVTHTPTAPGRHGDPHRLPALILGMVLDKPGYSPGPNAVTALADVRSRGHKPGHLAADRAYNNSQPEDFQLPVRALGYQPSYDYPASQLGIQASAYGALMIEGGWYCPSMPATLVEATSDLLNEKIEKETWILRRAARDQFELVPKGKPDADGHQRLMCPATAGRVQCVLKKDSLGGDPRLPLVDPEPSPAGPAKICAQHSATFAPEHGAKHWQALPYGSPDWEHVYFRLRNSVEGINGYAKDDANEALQRSGNRRIRGIAAQTLLTAFQLAQANQRKIDRWRDTLPGPTGQPRRRPTSGRRATKPLRAWTPAGYHQPAP